jgi:hypothetical protein
MRAAGKPDDVVFDVIGIDRDGAVDVTGSLGADMA